MKPLRWPTNSEQHAYMLQRQAENLVYCKVNRNERWMMEILDRTGVKWTRQTRWGYRIFDFWSPVLGVAVEVDGLEHDPAYDAHRDEYNFRRSAVVVLRVRNRNEEDAEFVLRMISKLGPWKDRRIELGIDGPTKKEKMRLLALPRFPSLLQKYLSKLSSK